MHSSLKFYHTFSLPIDTVIIGLIFPTLCHWVGAVKRFRWIFKKKIQRTNNVLCGYFLAEVFYIILILFAKTFGEKKNIQFRNVDHWNLSVLGVTAPVLQIVEDSGTNLDCAPASLSLFLPLSVIQTVDTSSHIRRGHKLLKLFIPPPPCVNCWRTIQIVLY